MVQLEVLLYQRAHQAPAGSPKPRMKMVLETPFCVSHQLDRCGWSHQRQHQTEEDGVFAEAINPAGVFQIITDLAHKLTEDEDRQRQALRRQQSLKERYPTVAMIPLMIPRGMEKYPAAAMTPLIVRAVGGVGVFAGVLIDPAGSSFVTSAAAELAQVLFGIQRSLFQTMAGGHPVTGAGRALNGPLSRRTAVGAWTLGPRTKRRHARR